MTVSGRHGREGISLPRSIGSARVWRRLTGSNRQTPNAMYNQLKALLTPRWVAETSSGHEVVGSTGFGSKLIRLGGDYLGVLALPVFPAAHGEL